MANFLKLLCLAFFFAIIVNGQSDCSTNELKVSQSPTGKKVAGKPEFNVTVTNNCFCTAINVKLSCAGFSSAEAIDSVVLSKSGDVCLLNDGRSIFGSSRNFSFSYAWDQAFAFTPLSADFACS